MTRTPLTLVNIDCECHVENTFAILLLIKVREGRLRPDFLWLHLTVTSVHISLDDILMHGIPKHR